MIAGLILIGLLWLGILAVISVAARAQAKWDPRDEAARAQYEAVQRIGRSNKTGAGL